MIPPLDTETRSEKHFGIVCYCCCFVAFVLLSGNQTQMISEIQLSQFLGNEQQLIFVLFVSSFGYRNRCGLMHINVYLPLSLSGSDEISK